MSAEPTRRSFAEILTAGLGGLITAALGALGGSYLLTPARARGTSSWTEAADVAKLGSGVPEEVVFERTRVDGWRVVKEKTSAWILKKSEQEVVAFAPGCTHLGCAYTFDKSANNFICPCHTSAFSLEGKVLTGPAPRALDRYDVQIDNGKVLLGQIKKA